MILPVMGWQLSPTCALAFIQSYIAHAQPLIDPCFQTASKIKQKSPYLLISV